VSTEAPSPTIYIVHLRVMHFLTGHWYVRWEAKKDEARSAVSSYTLL
jgi:hypothetical protein